MKLSHVQKVLFTDPMESSSHDLASLDLTKFVWLNITFKGAVLSISFPNPSGVFLKGMNLKSALFQALIFMLVNVKNRSVIFLKGIYIHIL